ncbi:acyl-homoserine-lactone acylase [Nocardioides thalensis]|uniref:Acyl-homoserine-lactone acylase n=1 Tax=Nocardioides thalensis TaxID=1914755 RepID=A0A853BWX4_9ACTN|nr:acyl-homoserine-lactone acylase [Nocardioides thalensis]
MRRSHVLALPVVAALVAGLMTGQSAGPGSAAGVPDRAEPQYAATIKITRHGIPHITADDFGSLGFGSGYAVADAAICNLADTLLTARGIRSRYLGPDGRYADGVSMDASNLQVDAFVTDLRNRQVVEKLLTSPAGPTARAQQLVTGYVAGVNEWLETNEVSDPACAAAPYLDELRGTVTSLDLWYGVYLANVLASSGVFVKEIVTASPPSPGDLGLPEIPGLPSLPKTKADVDEALAQISPAEREELLRSLGQDSDFGSNATAIGGDASSTGSGMILGNPHFPWQGRYKFTQQHLTIPGQYDVAGASLVGSPAVNIGWNNNVAWSHTVSTAYRFTPYEYTTVGPGTSYLSLNGLVKKAERRVVEVTVRRPSGALETVTEDLYRTPQGYVIDSPSQFMGWSPISFWAVRDANAEHLRTIDTFLDMGSATDVRDLLRRQDAGGGMPWVNTIAADRSGNALYADHSVVPHLTNDKSNLCTTPVGLLLKSVAGLPGLNGTLADGLCKWGSDADAQRPGILGPKRLPDVVRRDWVYNANDSFWLPNPATRLEGYPDIIGCERCVRTMRTRMVAQYVIDRLAGGGKETPTSLRGHEHDNRVRAAEVMRADGALDAVCARTGETQACAVLKAWDGRSDIDSVGTHIFEEFVRRLPASPWKVPFNASDPLNTPRGLKSTDANVVKAMKDAIASLRSRGVPFDAAWGDLQVAGDRGAPPIPIGGGEGDNAGNANAVGSRNATTNTDRYKPITYGSSHIQAVSFHAGGVVDARTILTYSQYEDPASPWSSDQTQLFSQEKWVRFAWTPAQIEQDLVRTLQVTG